MILLDERDRILLCRLVRTDSGLPIWFTPGGGLEDGEDVRAAARRELREETGLDEVSLGPVVWRRRHVFTWAGVEYDQREEFILARATAFVPDPSGASAEERAVLTWRWWAVDELAGAEEELAPRDLAARLDALLAAGPPPVPVDVGV